MYPSEFKHTIDFYDAFNKRMLPIGRMISSSKTTYLKNYPDHIVIFNANIITEEDGKIWYGDLDLTLDLEKLRNIALDLNKNLYILREYDARFGNENNQIEKLISQAVIKIDKI